MLQDIDVTPAPFAPGVSCLVYRRAHSRYILQLTGVSLLTSFGSHASTSPHLCLCSTCPRDCFKAALAAGIYIDKASGRGTCRRNSRGRIMMCDLFMIRLALLPPLTLQDSPKRTSQRGFQWTGPGSLMLFAMMLPRYITCISRVRRSSRAAAPRFCDRPSFNLSLSLLDAVFSTPVMNSGTASSILYFLVPVFALLSTALKLFSRKPTTGRLPVFLVFVLGLGVLSTASGVLGLLAAGSSTTPAMTDAYSISRSVLRLFGELPFRRVLISMLIRNSSWLCHALSSSRYVASEGAERDLRYTGTSAGAEPIGCPCCDPHWKCVFVSFIDWSA
jgi:hypothetical protein